MKIAIVTDAWFPHISGIATVLAALTKECEKAGHTVRIISPSDFSTIPLPGYPEIKLSLFQGKKLSRILDAYTPDAIHIPVEGPLGLAARRYCKKNNLAYTTAFHTRFPEYVRMRAGIPLSWTYAYLRWFHSGSKKVFVFTDALKRELESRGFKNLEVIPAGTDTDFFSPDNPVSLPYPRPIFTYMGRVAVEKNIEAFLALDMAGTKYVIGDGPARAELEKKYPLAVFTGYKFGADLVRELAAADVFVFPSLTDTLGLSMIEANACGVPIAALDSPAARSVITDGENGIISNNLQDACIRARMLSREKARETSLRYSWSASAKKFLENIR